MVRYNLVHSSDTGHAVTLMPFESSHDANRTLKILRDLQDDTIGYSRTQHRYTLFDRWGKTLLWFTYGGKPSPHGKFARNYAFRQRVLDCTSAEGKVAVVSSGMDCDCSTFAHITYVDANKVQAWIDEDQSWADGPVHYTLLTPAEALEFDPPPSRDLVMEAYEDGHPHLVSEVRYEST